MHSRAATATFPQNIFQNRREMRQPDTVTCTERGHRLRNIRSPAVISDTADRARLVPGFQHKNVLENPRSPHALQAVSPPPPSSARRAHKLKAQVLGGGRAVKLTKCDTATGRKCTSKSSTSQHPIAERPHSASHPTHTSPTNKERKPQLFLLIRQIA